MTAWFRGSFRNKIFVSVLWIALIPSLLCSFLVLHIQVVRSNRSARMEANAQLSMCGDRLSELCDLTEHVTSKLEASTVVHSVLRRNTRDSRILYQVLFRDAQELRQHACISVYLSDGTCGYSTEVQSETERLDTNWGILRGAANANELVYRGIRGEATALQAARAVRTYEGEILGYLVVTISSKHLDELFEDCYSIQNDLDLLDNHWESLYSSRPASAEKTADYFRDMLLSGSVPDKDMEEENAVYILQGKNTGFYLLLHQPITFTPRALQIFMTISALTGLFFMLLSSVYALILSRNLAAPVHEMDQAMEKVKKGDFSVRLAAGREDELGRLADSFNVMVQEYHENLIRSVENQRELNETKIRMMQAQLNPHFLYNTLDSVKWLGIAYHAPQIAELATDLAQLLRASISADEFFTVEQELDLVERYLEIQYIRFEDRFSCEIDVEERFQHCRIPKLALQPLVENAIIHGVADQDDGYIKITAEQDGEAMVISVKDNGCGIPEELAEQMNSSGMRIPGKHTGLYNVNQILLLHFGEGYGVKIADSSGQGSCIQLRLPMEAVS